VTINVSVFRPEIERVSKNDESGTIVVRIKTDEAGQTTLFFMPDPITTPIHERLSPVHHLTRFVSALLREAGFDYFEYDREGYQLTETVSQESVVSLHDDFEESAVTVY
jgi:hypothetical protein